MVLMVVLMVVLVVDVLMVMCGGVGGGYTGDVRPSGGVGCTSGDAWWCW